MPRMYSRSPGRDGARRPGSGAAAGRVTGADAVARGGVGPDAPGPGGAWARSRERQKRDACGRREDALGT